MRASSKKLSLFFRFSKPKFLFGCFVSTSLFYYLHPQPKMSSPTSAQSSPPSNYFPNIPEDELRSFLDKYPNLTCLNSNKQIEYLMSHLRDKNLDCSQFRYYADRVIRLLLEASIVVQSLRGIKKESPLGHYDAVVTETPLKDYCAVSILRAGNSFLQELLHLFPGIPMGQVLVQRNEESKEKEPIFYFSKLPKNIGNMKVLLCDPMVATGGSLCITLKHLKEKGIKEEDITVVALIGCFAGIEKIYASFPNVKVVIGFIDGDLMKNSKYIVPGLGDFGDRYFGTQ